MVLCADDLKNFENSLIWKAFLFDIDDRRAFLTDLLIKGNDPDWNDDMLRGKIDELEFFENIPSLLKASIIIESQNKTTEQKGVENG